jgi:hypothetical protein
MQQWHMKLYNFDMFKDSCHHYSKKGGTKTLFWSVWRSEYRKWKMHQLLVRNWTKVLHENERHIPQKWPTCHSEKLHQVTYDDEMLGWFACQIYGGQQDDKQSPLETNISSLFCWGFLRCADKFCMLVFVCLVSHDGLWFTQQEISLWDCVQQQKSNSTSVVSLGRGQQIRLTI